MFYVTGKDSNNALWYLNHRGAWDTIEKAKHHRIDEAQKAVLDTCNRNRLLTREDQIEPSIERVML